MPSNIAGVKCPHCNKPLPASFVDTRATGSKGGKVKGPSKARTREQAQAAIRARWAKYRATQAKV
jgi:hypothetical protein